jgi:integrase
MPKAQPVERRRLTSEEIASLVALDLKPGSRRRVVRDLYLVCFYAAGVRVSDALCLTPDNVRNDRLDYRMLKTGHIQSIKLPSQALELLSPYLEAAAARAGERRPYPYLFPLMKTGNDADPVSLRKRIQSANVRANKALKGVAKAAGIAPEGFTMHTARHSFADLARQAGDLYAVSKALGHSRLQTTQTYLSSFDRTAVDRLTDAMWSTTDRHSDTPDDEAR